LLQQNNCVLGEKEPMTTLASLENKPQKKKEPEPKHVKPPKPEKPPKVSKKSDTSIKINIKKYVIDIKNLLDEIEDFSKLNKYKYDYEDLNIIV
jgi:hypothetical protein